MSGVLVLEDGTVVRGQPFGSGRTVFGELVFNTNMTGYCEALTDPSYRGQILMMTYPLVGNYGVDPSTAESDAIQVTGFVVRDEHSEPFHPSSVMSLRDFLKQHDVPGLSKVDTRMLTIKTRDRGTLRAALSNGEAEVDELLKRVQSMPFPDRRNLVSEVSCNRIVHHRGNGKLKFILVDCGTKRSIIEQAKRYGDVVQVPYDYPPEGIRELKPDGVIVSNGPGDPAHPDMVRTTVRMLKEIASDFPIFGICLGHQLLALALGSKTYKLKFGHRGGNQPVMNLKEERFYITSQNHGFAVGEISSELEVTEVNLNDGTVEGIRHRELPIFSVQYHPEGAPGPHDSLHLFERFATQVKEGVRDWR